MTLTSKLSRRAQVISGVSLLAIAVCAGATGLYINVSHGLDVSVPAGILFGLSDLTKVMLPIVCGIIGWSRQMRVTAIVCVIASLWCASTAYLNGAGEQIAGKSHEASQYAGKKAQVEALEVQVASLDAQAAAEAKKGGCGKQCRYISERADKARLEAKEARAALASAKAVDVTGYERLVSAVTAGLFLVLVEALVWTSVPAMALLNAPQPKARKAKKAKKRKAVAKKVDWTRPEAYAKAPRMTKSGKIDGRTRQGRAVKKVTSRTFVTA